MGSPVGHRRNVVFIFVVGFLLTSCDSELVSDCEELVGVWHATYHGAFSGAGSIEVKSQPRAGFGHPILVTLFSSPTRSGQKPEALLKVVGVAHCSGEKIEATLGAGSGSSADYKVIGGRMVGIRELILGESPFGSWTVDLLQKNSLAPIKAQGFWRIHKELKTSLQK